MASIERTAYPRFKPTPSTQELLDLYTPTAEELVFAQQVTRSSAHLFTPAIPGQGLGGRRRDDQGYRRRHARPQGEPPTANSLSTASWSEGERRLLLPGAAVSANLSPTAHSVRARSGVGAAQRGEAPAAPGCVGGKEAQQAGPGGPLGRRQGPGASSSQYPNNS